VTLKISVTALPLTLGVTLKTVRKFSRASPILVGFSIAHYCARTQCNLRSEPSSRTALMGEQTNPWDLIQPQDAMSRHRGREPRRRYGLSGATTLLSPG
jgi:hypothetical protein